MREIELLAPAANVDVAIQAILHGADAVYMGGPDFGARKMAGNSIENIRRVVDFAHTFRAKVYVTFNTIIYDHELSKAERMIAELYHAGVDALIVQDMGILRMDIPPIQLHASTQCDTRTPEKAKFLQDVGFSQIVLARELTLEEIRDICNTVSVPVECFVHGALCVSYSGRCHASCATNGRSANRGECAQLCRLPYTLTDAEGKIISRDQHLLSLRDLNASDRIGDLLAAGVSSFKIEGRLKDADYVKNITVAYRQIVDKEIALHPDLYRRSSVGVSEIGFTPQLDKSFNRGFTHYFLDSRRPKAISQPATPKSMGEVIEDVSLLHNGDGISFFNRKGEYEGVMVNGVKDGKIIGNRPFILPKGAEIHRTYDRVWQQTLAKEKTTRRIAIDVKFSTSHVSATDERGGYVSLPMDAPMDKAEKTQDLRKIFDKLGNTHYTLREFESTLPPDTFIPASAVTAIRRKICDALDMAAAATYPFQYRAKEDKNVGYPITHLDYRENVANKMAEQFYREHGAQKIERALETNRSALHKGSVVMTTRHCILREMGKCLKQNPDKNFKLPLSIRNGRMQFGLRFDCVRCEMLVTQS